MATPFVRIGWNKYEAALLVEAYKDVVAGEVSRNDAISKLSDRLRNRMIVHGIAISDKYRNTNGIALQMSAVEYCFTDGQHGVSSVNKLFKEIIQLSIDSPQDYSMLLHEAYEMYPEPVRYEEQKPTPSLVVSSEESVNEERILDRNELAMVNQVLSIRFKKGFRLHSAIDSKRFRRFYEDANGKSFQGDDDRLTEIIVACGIEIEGKVYIPETMVQKQVKDEITDFIKDAFAKGKQFIYYDYLLKVFHDDLLDSMIVDRKSLRKYLEYYIDKKWFFSDKYIAIRSDVVVSIDNDVIEYIREQGRPVMEEEVVDALSWLPAEEVEHAFDAYPTTLITSGRNQRFHKDLFVITDEELGRISQIIDKAIATYKLMSAEELMDDIQANLPEVISNNSSIPEVGLRKAIHFALEDEYSFKNAVISKAGENLTAKETLISFAKGKGHFSIDEIDTLAKALGSLLNYHLSSILQYSIRVNDETFVDADEVEFDVEATDRALQRLLETNKLHFIPLKQIKNFAVFPEFEYPWNQRLLESYLVTQPSRFELYYGDYLNKNRIIGAVVDKRKCQYKDFDSLLAAALVDDKVPLKKAETLDYLFKEGYIGRRTYSNLDEVLSLAKTMRNNEH